ncbi:MAG: hypothetical protein HOE90_19665 [Bacteriovoracaceae bacterium]|jgi:ion channel POLLUX/CASTOR|nr:hypothetical protein [Bacteriovoracaceae bacterium]
MLKQFFNRLKYLVERFILSGLPYQVFIFALIIAGVSFIAGLVVFTASSEFTSFSSAMWWAFLRLTDPGYLGQDKGTLLRLVSTILSVLSYVLFLGALIALMTQWMYKALRELESGVTPLYIEDHILILGLTNRTVSLVEGILTSDINRQKFLNRLDLKKIKIVILCKDLDSDVYYKFKEDLGSKWNSRDIIIRGGDSLDLDDLRRVNFLEAAVVIMPGTNISNSDLDAKNVKTLLTIANYGKLEGYEGDIPPMVVEMLSKKKASIAQGIYGKNIEIISSDSLISRIIAQNARYTGLAFIYSELLRQNFGNGIYVREYPQFEGRNFYEIQNAFPKAIVIGILRKLGSQYVPFLNPPIDTILEDDDSIVLIARGMDDIKPEVNEQTVDLRPIRDTPIELPAVKRKILILGWNHHAANLIQFFSNYKNETYDIVNLARVDINDRKRRLSKFEINYEKINLQLIDGDYTAVKKLTSVKPETFTDIIMLSNDWLDSDLESDARIILGHLLLKDVLRGVAHPPDILAEIMDQDNEKLFPHSKDEILIPPLILSHMLSQAALTPEINEVYEDLLDITEHEISIVNCNLFGLVNKKMTVALAQQIVNQSDYVFLGYIKVMKNGGNTREFFLNPERKEEVEFTPDDEIIILI